MSFDVIADMFCSLNNAKAVDNTFVRLPHSKIKVSILELLKKECVISDFSIEETKNKKKFLNIKLIYVKKIPTFKKISRISKSSLRNYKKSHSFVKLAKEEGFYIVSTSKLGIISSKEALLAKVGGEIIGKVL